MKPIIQDINELTDSKELLAARSSPFIVIFLYILLVILVLAGVWSYFGEIDDYVKASGIIRPNDKISTIQNVVAGKVVQLNYEEGTKVRQGDVLYIVEHTSLELDRDTSTIELEKASVELQNLRLLRKSYIEGNNHFSDYPSQGNSISAISYSKFSNRYVDYTCHIEQLENSIEQKREIYATSEKLYNSSAKSYKDFSEAKYQFNNANSDLQKYKMDALTQTDNDITTTEDKVATLRKEIDRVNTCIRDAIVKAPIDGIINVLTDISVGDYVLGQTRILTIVPENNAQYKVIIYVDNKDIANIKEGQMIKYDFSALPYKEYGEMTGIVTKLGTDATSGEQKTEGKHYIIEATVENKPVFNHKGQEAVLKVGMTCDARIVTESKKMLYYILEKINLRE